MINVDNTSIDNQGADRSSGKDKPRCRRRIEICKGRLAEVVDEAEQALIDTHANVYVRGGILVRVVRTTDGYDENQSINRQDGVPLIAAHTITSIADCLNRVVLFVRRNQRSQELHPIDCPKEVAETLLSRIGMWRFRKLKAVITAPTLRPDGSILLRQGYDCATGLLLQSSIAFPRIPEKPLLRDARAALKVLEALLEDFPFVSEGDRAASIAMLLTAIVRPSLPTAPLFAITAPTPGTGKSYLADLASVLATGEKAAVVGASCDEDELEKRLGASLMAGDRVLSLDNIDRPIKSERLCQILTQEAVKLRILGRSTNIDTPTNALMIATGNALRVHSDLTRRVLLIRLDAREERPELRQFKHDPVNDAIAERPKYVAAAMVILRAFIVIQQPALSPPLGSFEKWSHWVRSALIWLGLADPVLAMDEARSTDPERERTSEILSALLPEGTWTTKDLPLRSFHNSSLQDALAGFTKLGQFDKHAFGNWCHKHRDRPVNGMMLVQAGRDTKAKVNQWHVKALQ